MTAKLGVIMAGVTGLLGALLGYPLGGIGGAVLYAILLAIGGALLGVLVGRTARVAFLLAGLTRRGSWRLLAAAAGMLAFIVITWGVYL